MIKLAYNPYFDVEKDPKFYCPICKRLAPKAFQEEHHLVPKSKKGKETVTVCVNCGDMIHKIFTNQELKLEYNSVKKILSHPDTKKWIEWISKKPADFSVCMKRLKKR